MSRKRTPEGRERWIKSITTHGHTKGKKSPEYSSWATMKDRCMNQNATAYSFYGGRGITVCARWMSFENFLADMGPRPSPQHTLDRFPNHDGNYEPGNCRWATREEQNNNRRDCVYLEYDGLRMTIAQWSRKIGRSMVTLSKRKKRGWTDAQIIEGSHPSARPKRMPRVLAQPPEA